MLTGPFGGKVMQRIALILGRRVTCIATETDSPRMNSIQRACIRDAIGLLEVRETDGEISLHFGNHTEQSSWRPDRPDHLAFSYYRALVIALILHPSPRRLDLFGLGGGVLARFLLEYSDLEIHAHDYRPDLRDLARDHFGLNTEHPRLSLHFADISSENWQMPATGRQSDLMLLDLFDEQGMAPVPERSLALMADALTEEGLICVNVWRSAMQDTSRLHKQMIRIFDRYPLVMHIPHRMNTVMCYRRQPWTRQDLRAAQARLRHRHPALRTAIAEAWQWLGELPPGAGT